MGSIVLLCMGVLVAKLWWVQVVRGDYYASIIQKGGQVTVRLPAVRGEIKDRNGVALVENRRSFEVDFYLPDIVRAYQKEHNKVPMQPWRRFDRHGNPVDDKEPDIPTVVNATVIERLRQLDLEQDYNAEQLQVHFRNEREIPFTYREDLDFETMARYMENNVDLPGLKAEVKAVRNYPYGALAAHILGYVGPPQDISKQRAEEAAKGRVYNFYQPDMEGRAQVEKLMDEQLRGTAGVRILQKDAKGQIIEGDVELVPPKPGNDVYLTIDARLQGVVEETLKVAGRAGAVVIDPNNGDILAMASVPSFDPNIFIPKISARDWAEITNDETEPLMNRAINAYVPGSTYKIVTALAGLKAGIGARRFTCSGGVTYGDHFMKCWIFGKGSHGSLDLEGAIKVSCNAYFAQYLNTANIEPLEEIGKMLGLGQLSGLGLSGESPGVLDGKEHLARVSPRERWRPGLSANVAIGQGQVLATPLQMAIVAAAVANGGTVYYPRLIDRVVDKDGNIVEQQPAKVRANLITDAGIKPEDLEHVRKGMWRVVNENGGTARKARLAEPEHAVSGKTGTAQNWRVTKDGIRVKDNNVLFIAFAPYEKPRYAVCVLVQGGESGGQVAAPLAGKILDEAFKLEEGGSEYQLARVEPAKGNFRHISSIDFGAPVPVALSDGETVANVEPATATVRAAPVAAAPAIRAEPDARGRVEQPKKERKGLLNFFNSSDEKKKTNESSGSPKRNPFRR